jgi:hypothetical protein
MGYTHYFSHKKTSKKKWMDILADCKKLHEADDVSLCHYGDDNDSPVFNQAQICFNGMGSDGHETFQVLRAGVPQRLPSPSEDKGFQFCKTARKPYDTLVCACLLVYMQHSPDTMDLGSDGDPSDWKDAENFVKDLLGYDITFAKITGEPEEQNPEDSKIVFGGAN